MEILRKDFERNIQKIMDDMVHSASIVKWVATPKETFEGQEIIDFKVIYESKNKKIDSREVLDFNRQLRNYLVRRGELSFPVVHFILKSEAKDLIEAA